MKRSKEGNAVCHAPLGMLISFVLVGSLVGAALCDDADMDARSAIAWEHKPQMQAEPVIEMRYLTLGYRVCGPVKVCAFAPPDFQIWVPNGALKISMKDKTLSVMDVEGRELPQSAVGRETEVYVCLKAHQLFVIVLGQQEGVE